MTIRVLIADDQELVRAGFRLILERQDGIEVVGEACDGVEAVQLAAESRPDVGVMDIRMPNLDGIQAARRILEHRPDTAVVIISAYDNLEFLAELVRDGPEGKAYLLKSSLDDIDELIRTVEAVTQGETVIDPSMVHKLARLYSRRPEWSPVQLTEVEQDVLELLVEGYADQDVVTTLHLQLGAFARHLDSIYAKLGLSEKEGSDQRLQVIQAFVARITALLAEGDHGLDASSTQSVQNSH